MLRNLRCCIAALLSNWSLQKEVLNHQLNHQGSLVSNHLNSHLVSRHGNHQFNEQYKDYYYHAETKTQWDPPAGTTSGASAVVASVAASTYGTADASSSNGEEVCQLAG